MDKKLREILIDEIRRAAKWFLESGDSDELPDKDTIDGLYQWLNSDVKPFVTRRKFRVLLDIRITTLRSEKGQENAR